MNSQRVAFALTLVNLALLAFLLGGGQSVASRDDPQMLRGKGLQIVDDNGRVRASVTIYRAGTGNDGMFNADSVVFRLINPDGKPGVKIAASDDDAGAAFVAEQGTYAQIMASRAGSTVRLTNKDGRVQSFMP